MKWLIFLSILWLLGCGSNHYGQEYTIYIDPGFGDKVEEVIDGANDWGTKGKGILTVHIVIGLEYIKKPGDIVIHAHSVADIPNVCSVVPLIGNQREEGCTARGPIDDVASIYLAFDTHYFKNNVRHELGHAFGLQHDNLEKDAIMYPYSQERHDHISCKDVFQYAMLRNIISPCR